nr:ABC transporter permease [Candidatus Njordarchaeum guaymaensis]
MVSIKRSLALTVRIWRQIRRDRRTMGLIIIVPIAFVLVIGYGFSVKVADVKTGFIDDDHPSLVPDLSNSIIETLADDRTVALSNLTGTNLQEAEELIRSGHYTCIVHFPENFSQALITHAGNVTITILIDNTNPQVSQAVLGSIHLAMEKQLTKGSNIGFETTYVYGNEELKTIDFMAPGIVSFAIMIIAILLSVVLLVRERRDGTLERILASPATKMDIILGYMFAFSVISAIQSTIVLGLTVILFDLTIRGSIILAYAIIVLFAMGSLTMGIALSVLAKTELQAVQFVPMVIFPSIILGGLLIPIETMPSWLQVFSYLIPMTYSTQALRDVMVKGLDITAVSGYILALLLFLALMLFLAVKTFREEL